jgi:3-oxoacyl-[acyl-carrier-protein] synthase-3
MNMSLAEKPIGGSIVGVVSCLPKSRIENDFFLANFSQDDIENVRKMAGVETRYWVQEESAFDLSLAASVELLSALKWDPLSIDAVLYVSQSPDYLLPATSIKLAGSLGLRNDVIALDINLGCSGYPYGLFMADAFISTGLLNRVLLIASETTSKIIDKKDKSTAMIFGDAGSATAIQAESGVKPIYVFGADASGQKNLIVPSSRFCNIDVSNDSRFRGRDLNYIYMDGAEVFNFTLKRVPTLVSDTEKQFGHEFDFYLFHQANKFMLNYLSKKMHLDARKVLTNISDYGNTSCASIPLLMTTSLKEELQARAVPDSVSLGIFGFGVGYSWGGCAKRIDKNIILGNVSLT